MGQSPMDAAHSPLAPAPSEGRRRLGTVWSKVRASLGVTPQVALGLAAGAAGMVAADRLSLPGGMLIGAILAPAIARVAGAPVDGPPPWLKTLGRTVLGVIIGAAVTGQTLATGARAAGPIAIVIAAMTGLGLVGAWIVHRTTRMPVPSALCGSTPGVLNAMVALADDLGGDSRLVATMHLVRVVTIPLIVPAFVELFFRPGMASAVAAGQPSGDAVGWLSVAGLLALGGAGAWLAIRLRVPAGDLLGGLVVAAVANPLLLHVRALPSGFMMFAIWSVGVAVGATVSRQVLREFKPFWAAGLLMTGFLIVSGLAVAVFLARMAGLDQVTSILACTPGGADQMVILAGSLGGDAALVAAVHVTRQIILMLTLPVIMRLVMRRTSPAPAGNCAGQDAQKG